ncbi:MAG TPA: hypothetical protein VFJ16_11655, partial [Longimicrobium sp.]|nr:hypothetical protein [Longimicrobium sp.]
NALSIEIFFRNTRFRRSPRRLRLQASFTASSGEIEPSRSSVRLRRRRGTANDRHPALDAQDVHDDWTRLVIP